MTITYEVTVEIDAADAERFADYMKEEHIREVVGTGCFDGAIFERSEDGRFRTRYVTDSRERLDSYYAEFSGEMRRRFLERFPDASASRSVWTEQ